MSARSSASTSRRLPGERAGLARAAGRPRGRGAHAPRPLVDPGVRLPRARRPPGLPRPGVVDARRGHPPLPELGPGRVGRRGPLRQPAAVDRRADPGGRRLRRGRPLRVGADAVVATARVRSNGSEFTVESLGRYHLHDVVHHLHDVRDGAAAATVRAYDDAAAEYRDGTADLPDAVAAAIGRLAAVLPRVRGSSRSGAGPDATPPHSRRPACGSVVRTSRPPSSRCCGPTATTPTCSTRSPTTWPTRPRPARRTTRCGPTPACCTSTATTCPTVLGTPRRGHPPRRAAPRLAEGGRRGGVVGPRTRVVAASLHVLA